MKDAPKLILFLSLIAGMSCVDLPDDIIPPQWDVDLNVPVLNRLYFMSDIIDENNNIYSGEADSIYVIQSDEYDVSTGIMDNLVLQSESSLNDIVVTSNNDSQSILLLFPEGIELDSAVFSSGRIHYDFYNPTGNIIYLSLSIPGISKDGITLHIQRVVYPYSYDSSYYDLEDHKYQFPAGQHASLKRFLIVYPTIVSSNSSDSIICNFANSNFQFSSITGKIGRKTLGDFNETFPLKLGDALKYRDKIFLREASLSLGMNYSSYYNSFFKAGLRNVRITGKRNNGEMQNLYFRDGSSINISLMSEDTEIIFNDINSNINEFLTFLPDEIEITAEHIINPGNEDISFTATNKDSVNYQVFFRTRGYLALRNTTLTDTFDLSIGGGDRESISNSKSAQLNINFENAIPLTASFKVVLADINYDPLFIITRNSYGGDSILVEGGEIHPLTGDIVAPSSSLQQMVLNRNEIAKLADSYYAIVSTTLKTKESSGGTAGIQMVPIKISNWVNVRAFGTIKYHVNPEE